MHIRYTTDPVRIAFATSGSGGPTLVAIPGWVSHLTFDWATPAIRDYYERLAHGRRLIRYDKRGTGLSDRPAGPAPYEIAVQVEDLRAVLDAAGAQQAVLVGWSEGGPIGLAFAAQYPDRVSRLILYSTAAAWAGENDAAVVERRAALVALVRSDWGFGSRVLADLFLPERDDDHLRWFTEYQRAIMSPQVAACFLEAIYRIDVRALLPAVTMPALVLHRRADTLIAFARGVALAAALPDAQLVALDGDYHAPYFGDSLALTRAIDDYLDPGSAVGPAPNGLAGLPALTPRELEVLRLVAEGCPNREIAARLSISPATVARHLANLFAKVGVSTRAAATAYAFRHHLNSGLRQTPSGT